MEVIKDGEIAINEWQHVADDEALPEGKATLSLKRWREEKDGLTGRGTPLGLRLTAADIVEEIVEALRQFDLIVLDMTQFTDGRVFSQARLLRERFGFTGELRVRGDFIRDQMFFLSRVGVNAFEFPEGTDLENMRRALGEFSVAYQAATDVRDPLYRRRS
jgi:uncharacterized protein (DUF934 family)